MIRCDRNGLRYYQFESLNSRGVPHGIFTRLGGVSPEPWDSLNLGSTVGDDRENVQANLGSLTRLIGAASEQLVQVHQVHSRDVYLAEGPFASLPKGDGMITDRPGAFLLMRFADCVPILLYDPEHSAVGIAHAGWKGTALNVAGEIVNRMEFHFGSDPRQIIAGIGPSIGPDHYTVGSEVISVVKQAFPGHWQRLLSEEPDGVKLDLWAANEFSLREAGLESIEIAGICTGCNTGEWYSHRAEQGKTGRFGAVISLESYG